MPNGIEEVLSRFRGCDSFLPLQKQAMECICRGWDSMIQRVEDSTVFSSNGPSGHGKISGVQDFSMWVSRIVSRIN